MTALLLNVLRKDVVTPVLTLEASCSKLNWKQLTHVFNVNILFLFIKMW